MRRRTFLRNGLWLLGAPSILRAQSFSNVGFIGGAGTANLTAAGGSTSLKTDLVGWWAMEDNMNDSHTGGLNLTTAGTITFVTGKVNKCSASTGSVDNRMYRADESALKLSTDTPFTLASWVNWDSLGALSTIFNKGAYNFTGDEFILYYTTATSRIKFGVGNGSTNQTVEANNLGAPSVDIWYYVVAWHDPDANTINVQVNNGTADSAVWSGGTQGTTSNFSVGGSSAGTYCLAGNQDEVAYWKRVLTSDERTWLYNSGNGRSYSDL